MEGSSVQRHAGADSFRREKPDAAFVLAYAIGHNTIREWNPSPAVRFPGSVQ
jgi:hypothetical protein